MCPLYIGFTAAKQIEKNGISWQIMRIFSWYTSFMFAATAATWELVNAIRVPEDMIW
jgi:hypothetical protein